MNPAFRCVCVCVFMHVRVWRVWLYGVCLRGRGGGREWGVYTSMHACMHPCRDPLHVALPPSLSIYHASIGLSASGMRCGERGRGAGYMVGGGNKFSPPTLKMHIHFHTLKRQWGAHTHCCCIPNMSPLHRHTHNPKHQIQLRWMCVSRSVGAGENLPLAIFIFIRAEGACVFVCIYTGSVPGVCVCLFFCVSVCT